MTSPTLRRGPAVTPTQQAVSEPMLWAVRGAFVIQAALAVAQPVLAGRFLAGEEGALAIHGANAGILLATALVALATAALFRFAGRGAGWPVLVLAGLFVADLAQMTLNGRGAFTVHVPLGVAIVGTTVALAVWSFHPAARQYGSDVPGVPDLLRPR